MMKQARYVVALAAAIALPGEAFATGCVASTNYQLLNLVQVGNLLGGAIVCYPASAPFTNQEFHSGGIIGDYKKGASDPIDPSVSNIGTYSVGGGPVNIDPGTGASSGGGTVSYTYTGGGAGPTYSVWGVFPLATGSYDFCSGGTGSTLLLTVRVKYQAGAMGPCP